jgi:hypothetical protein
MNNNYTYAHKDLSIVNQKEEVSGGPAVVHLPVALKAPALQASVFRHILLSEDAILNRVQRPQP